MEKWKNFYGKTFMQKMCTKKWVYIYLVNNPKQPLHAINSFKNILKEDYQKALKKLTSFFLLKPVPFNGQSYQKQKGPGTSDQSLFKLQKKFRKIPLLVI